MIVAVTGGTGFIGRHLVARHIATGDEVRYLTRNNSVSVVVGATAIIGDLNDIESLPALVKGVDVLYHCAAELHDQQKMYDVNVLGTNNLLDMAKGEVKRWVQLSSTGVYGAKPMHDVDENTSINPGNDYEKSKAIADELVVEYISQGYFDGVILRPSNVYGIDMPNQSLFQLIKMVKRGWFFFIGSKGSIVNYIHVDNVIEALMLCAIKPLLFKKGDVYIISDSQTVEEFISVIAQAVSVPCPNFRLPEFIIRLLAMLGDYLPNFPLRSPRVDALTYKHQYKTHKIENALGYQHKISMAEGIEELVRYAK